jgi:hypothetical protein
MQTPSLTRNGKENTHKSEYSAQCHRKGRGRTCALRMVLTSTPLVWLKPPKLELCNSFQPFPPGGFGGGGGVLSGADAGAGSVFGLGFLVLSFFAIKFVFNRLNLF